MEIFSIALEDRRRLSQWVRYHVAAWIVIATLLTLGSLAPTTGQSHTDQWHTGHTTPMVIASSDAHLPEGWRRTTTGWQHTSNWLSSGKSINTLIQEQRSREPQWIQRSLQVIRHTSPLTIAMLQLIAITTVVVATTKPNLTQ